MCECGANVLDDCFVCLVCGTPDFDLGFTDDEDEDDYIVHEAFEVQ